MKKYLFLASIFLAIAIQGLSQNAGYKIGDKAIDFNLKSTDGKFYSLESLKKGKGFIVIFTCNHCPFSQAYEQRIIALHKKYAPKGMPVVAINPNDSVREPEDSYENMKKRAKKYKYPFVYLVDETQAIAKAYGAMRTPHVFVLDANRNVIYIGAIDDNFEDPKLVKEKYLENALDAFLNGKPITNPLTKAIGCGIKWKK
jgi:peroxiredoxin